MSDSLQRLKLTLCCLILCFAPKLNASRVMYKDNSIQYPPLSIRDIQYPQTNSYHNGREYIY